MVQPESGCRFDESNLSQFWLVEIVHSLTSQCIFLSATGTGICGCESLKKKRKLCEAMYFDHL